MACKSLTGRRGLMGLPCCVVVDVPFDDLLDLKRLSAADGEAVYEVTVDARHHNPTGRVHGGLLSSLADTAMGAAFLSALPGDVSGTNLDLSMRFLRAVVDGRLEARAHTVKAGRRVSLMACEIRDAEGRLVATAQSQFLTL